MRGTSQPGQAFACLLWPGSVRHAATTIVASTSVYCRHPPCQAARSGDMARTGISGLLWVSGIQRLAVWQAHLQQAHSLSALERGTADLTSASVRLSSVSDERGGASLCTLT